jgi:signal transduction histidine kinase
VSKGLHLASGRVIALGRLLFATLFLVAIFLDTSQPARYPGPAYGLLLGYTAFALAIAAATWNSWWADARLAGPAHAVDIALFTTMVFLTQGATSPFFTFFIFILLSAAIRWGWRSTALTALLLTLLYALVGFVTAASDAPLELDRFITRTGHLVIVSLILIWFGVNQWRARLYDPAGTSLADPAVHTPTAETALRAAMAGTRAGAGAFVWVRTNESEATATVACGADVTVSKLPAEAASTRSSAPFLYDLVKNRALGRDINRNLRRFRPTARIPHESASALQLREGLAIPVSSTDGEGTIYLEQVRGLSSDHLELGEQIAAAVATHFQRRALMKAAEESAESHSRLAIARDLHDSVVQFLAGAAFRLEAMKRSAASRSDLTSALEELKQLMLQEQGELRAFITALRSGSQVYLAELATDLQALSDRLSRQWDIQCTFSAQPREMAIPTRLHFDAQQLVREAVANAVRHAGAKNVSIRLAGEGDQLTLDFINDGSAFPKTSRGGRLPVSLRERAEAAGGALELSRGMGVTKISISLPVAGKAA